MEEQHSLRDGRILIYKRGDSPYYQMRLKIHGRKGAVVRSTKSKSYPEACITASETYDDLRYKVQNDIEIEPHTFNSIWKRWLETHKNLISIHRLKYITGTANRYLLPYFGELRSEQITSQKVQAYWTWRINFWTSEEGQQKIQLAQKSRTTEKRPYKQKLGNVAKTPAQKSLQMEQSVLRQILHWANQSGIIGTVPEIKAPKIHKNKGIVRRPAFELEEWKILYRFLREWVKAPKASENRPKQPSYLAQEPRSFLHPLHGNNRTQAE